MSRVGRDYLQVGFYTEVFFREKGVRFIAVSNGVELVIGFPSFPFARKTAVIFLLQSRRYHSFIIFKKGANSLLVLFVLSTPLETAIKRTPFSRKNTSV